MVPLPTGERSWPANLPMANKQALVVRGHVVGGQLPTVHRRLVVEEDVVADRVDVGQRIRVLPAFGQVPSQYALGPVGRKLADTPVGRPVRDTQLVQRCSHHHPSGVAEPRVAVVGRACPEYRGEGPTVFRLQHLLAGGRVGHVLLLGGHCRGVVFAGGAGERNGSHQRERQCHEPKKSKSHSAPPCIGMADDLRPAIRVLVVPVTPACWMVVVSPRGVQRTAPGRQPRGSEGR